MIMKRRSMERRELIEYERENDCIKIQGKKYWASVNSDPYGYVIIIHKKNARDTVAERIVSGNNMFDQSIDRSVPYSHPDAIPEDDLIGIAEEQARDLLREWDGEVI